MADQHRSEGEPLRPGELWENEVKVLQRWQEHSRATAWVQHRQLNRTAKQPRGTESGARTGPLLWTLPHEPKRRQTDAEKIVLSYWSKSRAWMKQLFMVEAIQPLQEQTPQSSNSPVILQIWRRAFDATILWIPELDECDALAENGLVLNLRVNVKFRKTSNM